MRPSDDMIAATSSRATRRLTSPRTLVGLLAVTRQSVRWIDSAAGPFYTMHCWSPRARSGSQSKARADANNSLRRKPADDHPPMPGHNDMA